MKKEPKIKAKQLIEKLKPSVYCYSGSGMLTNTYDESIAIMMAKHCAIISVDLSIETCDATNLEYLNELKTEIINYGIEVSENDYRIELEE